MDLSYEEPFFFFAEGNRHLGVVNPIEGEEFLCIIIPGSGAQSIDGQVGPNLFLLQLGNKLKQSGIPNARFGKRPITTSHYFPKDYQAEYIRPIRAMLQALKDKGFSSDKIFILGHSLGGHIAPLIANSIDQKCLGIILFNSHLTLLPHILDWQINSAPHAMKMQFAGLSQELKRALLATKPTDLSELNELYLFNALHYDPIAEISALKDVPILLLNSDTDAQIPTEQFHDWEACFASRGITYQAKLFTEVNHIGMKTDLNNSRLSVFEKGEIDDQIIAEMVSWMKLQLNN